MKFHSFYLCHSNSPVTNFLHLNHHKNPLLSHQILSHNRSQKSHKSRYFHPKIFDQSFRHTSKKHRYINASRIRRTHQQTHMFRFSHILHHAAVRISCNLHDVSQKLHAIILQISPLNSRLESSRISVSCTSYTLFALLLETISKR